MCVGSRTFAIFDLFNFFYFPLFSSSGMRGAPSRSSPSIGTQHSVWCLIPMKKRTQSENWQKQKDIKLKVVKTSSRFSIYFQLHFRLSPGCLPQMCFFVKNSRPQRQQKNCGKPECVNVACYPSASMGPTKNARKPNKIIYCFSICEILFDYNSHISIIFLPSSYLPSLVCPLPNVDDREEKKNRIL